MASTTPLWIIENIDLDKTWGVDSTVAYRGAINRLA